MNQQQLLKAMIFGAVFAASVTAMAEDSGQAILQKATIAMGAGNLESIQYSGTGKAGTLGQSYLPGEAWPTLIVKSYTRTIDYKAQSSREEMVRTLENPPVKGGGAPFQGEQKQVNIVSGLYAWNMAGDTPQAAPATLEERQLQIVSTPRGFLKQALISNTTAKKTKGGTEVTYSLMGKFKVTGLISSQGIIEKVETALPNPVLGDMAMETTFSDYKDYNGAKFPSHIVQTQGGHMVLDLNVTSVVPNAPNAEIVAPDAVKTAKAPPAEAVSQKLADGVWFIGGASHNSVVIEGKEFITVVEAPLSEERSLAVIAEAKRLAPGKPIRYLVNTHHHFDHSSGVRTYVAEGATIITSEVNKDFYEQAWKAPRTLMPDNLSRTPKKATFVTVKDTYTLDDGVRKLELHLTEGDQHNGAILFGYLPAEKILIEADDFTPPPPNGTIVPLAKTFGDGLYDNITRLKLDIQTIAPLHGRVVPYADMPKALGKA